MAKTTLFTIGFTKKSAEAFFSKIKGAGIKRVIDIRLNNVSQLAGFAKRDDLKYFLKTICNCDYAHETILSPSPESARRLAEQKGRLARVYGAVQEAAGEQAGQNNVRRYRPKGCVPALRRADRRALPPQPRRRALQRNIPGDRDRAFVSGPAECFTPLCALLVMRGVAVYQLPYHLLI